MYRNVTDNVEIYFICYKKEMELIESYYDEILDVHAWYFNAYLAYKHWKQGFKDLIAISDLGKMLLTVAASRYIMYKLENKEYKNNSEKKVLLKDLTKIEPNLNKIINDNEFLNKLS